PCWRSPPCRAPAVPCSRSRSTTPPHAPSTGASASGASAATTTGCARGPDPRPRMRTMPSIGRDDVARLADLARIQLTDEEIDRFAGEFDSIMHAVVSVSEVATEDVPATSHPIAMTNVFREDVVENTLTQEQALAGAPAAEDGRFAVPQILGEERSEERRVGKERRSQCSAWRRQERGCG